MPEKPTYDELGKRVQQAEEAHKEINLDLILEKRKLQDLFDIAPILIVRYDRDLRRTYVNPAWEKASGLSAAKVINVPHTDIPSVPVPAVDEYIQKIRQVLETGVPKSLEFTWVNADGVKLFLDYIILPEYDRNKKITGVLAVGRDITNRKRAEEELIASRDYFNKITNSMYDAMFSVKMPERVIEWVNDSFEIFGYKPDECIGRTTEFLHPSKDAFLEFGSKIRNALEKGQQVFQTEQTLVKKNGETFPSEIVVILHREEGSTNVIAIARDITERKQVEEELRHSQQELRNLTNYLQSVREQERKAIARELHDELGQTIAGLKMDLAWLEKRVAEDPDAALKKIKAMEELAGQSMKLTKQIISRLRPGMLDDLGLIAGIEWGIADFEERTGTVCDLYLNVDDKDFSEELSIAVFRIFQEALSNVQRHSGAEMVQIRLEQKQDQLILTVKDNGEGIKTKQISHPESFGLMGIRERVHQLNGQYSIEGIDAEGTTVTVTFPIPK